MGSHLSVPACCSQKQGRASSGLSAGLITGDLLGDAGASLEKQAHAVCVAATGCQSQGRALAVVSVRQEGPPVQQQLQHLCMALRMAAAGWVLLVPDTMHELHHSLHGYLFSAHDKGTVNAGAAAVAQARGPLL